MLGIHLALRLDQNQSERVKFSGEGRTPKLLMIRMSKCKGMGV